MHGRASRSLAGILIVGAVLWGAGSCPARAQVLPGSPGVELTVLPGMRAGATPPSTKRDPEKRHRVGTAANRAAPETAAASRHTAAESPHPVELGVTMRGGSGTPRVYGATGTSEAIQESGSAFGAGMRFGF